MISTYHKGEMRMTPNNVKQEETASGCLQLRYQYVTGSSEGSNHMVLLV
jgi:hypothetical protein